MRNDVENKTGDKVMEDLKRLEKDQTGSSRKSCSPVACVSLRIRRI